MKKKTKELLLKMGVVNKGIFNGSYGSPKVDWWEHQVFNECRLYTALGKEDARTVLLIWRRYKETIELLREIQKNENCEEKKFVC